MGFRPYESVGTVCTGFARPGTKNLLTAANDLWDYSMSFGIYNCRLSTAGSQLSMHAEGRAADIGFPVIAGEPHPTAYDLFGVLRTNAWELGIQYIIFDRRSYSKAYPWGKPYLGPNPHIDHLHVEQTREAAGSLSLDAAYFLLGDDMLTAEQETALNELVAVRKQVIEAGSSLSLLIPTLKLIKLMRNVDNLFDSEEF